MIVFLRVSVDQKQRILIVQNVSSMNNKADIALPKECSKNVSTGLDLMSGQLLPLENHVLHLQLQSFMIRWIELS